MGVDELGPAGPALTEQEARARDVNVAAALFVVAGAVTLATLGMLPGVRHRGVLAAVGAVTVAAGLAIPLLPWPRWPRRSLLLLPIGGLALVCASGAVSPDAWKYYMPMAFLPFVYTGLTQGPGYSAVLALPAVGLFILGTTVDPTTQVAFAFVIVLALAVLTGETLALAVQGQEEAEHAVERLFEGSRRLARCEDEIHAVGCVAAVVQEMVRGRMARVWLHDRRDPARFPAAVPAGASAREIVIDPVGGKLGEVRAVTVGEPLFVGSTRRNPGVAERWGAPGVGALLVLAIPGDFARHGYVVVGWNRRQRRVARNLLAATQLLLAEAGRTLERLRSTARLAVEAETDALTNLANRRSFERALSRMSPGDAVVVLDLDHFKNVNDRWGHAVGDEALRTIAALLRQVARTGDCVARFGGDEMAMVLAQTGVTGACGVMERLRDTWVASDPVTTFSAGLAVLSPREQPRSALARADEALYAAKGAGRDWWELAPEPDGTDTGEHRVAGTDIGEHRVVGTDTGEHRAVGAISNGETVTGSYRIVAGGVEPAPDDPRARGRAIGR